MEGYAKLQVNGNEKDDVIFIPIQVHIPSEICPQTISSSWMVSVVSMGLHSPWVAFFTWPLSERSPEAFTKKGRIGQSQTSVDWLSVQLLCGCVAFGKWLSRAPGHARAQLLGPSHGCPLLPRTWLPETVTERPSVAIQSLVGTCSGLIPQESNCQWTTARGPAQPLVGAAVGPSPKWVTVKRWPLLSPSTNGRCCPEEETKVRDGSRPSPWLSGLSGLGPVGELGGPGNRLRPVPCRASRALAKSAYWLGPGLEASANFSPIPASATWWQQPVWDVVWGCCPCSLGSLKTLRSLRARWVGHLAPSVMTGWRGLGSGPWGSDQLRSVSSQAGPGAQRMKAVPWEPCPFLSEQRVNFSGGDLRDHLWPDRDWPQEERLSH